MNRKAIFDITGGHCFYCGCRLDYEHFHTDHFIPKAKGGKDHNNLVPTCPDCNLYKGSLSIAEFRKKIEDSINSKIQGRIISKYSGVQKIDVVFYFERMKNGDL